MLKYSVFIVVLFRQTRISYILVAGTGDKRGLSAIRFSFIFNSVESCFSIMHDADVYVLLVVQMYQELQFMRYFV